MGKIAWTIIAKEDLKEIGDYIALDSLTYARRTVSSLISKTIILRTQPFIGRSVPERPEYLNVRELIAGSYRIIYKISDPNILILRVLHTARHFPDSF